MAGYAMLWRCRTATSAPLRPSIHWSRVEDDGGAVKHTCVWPMGVMYGRRVSLPSGPPCVPWIHSAQLTEVKDDLRRAVIIWQGQSLSVGFIPICYGPSLASRELWVGRSFPRIEGRLQGWRTISRPSEWVKKDNDIYQEGHKCGDGFSFHRVRARRWD